MKGKAADLASFGRPILKRRSDDIRGTKNAEPAPIEYMAIDHGGVDVTMAEQFLNRSYVVTVFQKLCREAVPAMPNSA